MDFQTHLLVVYGAYFFKIQPHFLNHYMNPFSIAVKYVFVLLIQSDQSMLTRQQEAEQNMGKNSNVSKEFKHRLRFLTVHVQSMR